MNEEEKKALKVINTRTRRLLDELEIEKEDMSDEPKIAYLMQEIRANKTILNLIEKLQKENNKLKEYYEEQNEVNAKFISVQKVKDKIEKLNKIEQDLQNSISMEEREEYSDANISWDLMNINIRREELEELIEEREDN